MPYTEKCLKCGISPMDLSHGRAVTWGERVLACETAERGSAHVCDYKQVC